ncbi:MAG: beta-N-acetylhexosaminidase [Promethearchaeota archaeon]
MQANKTNKNKDFDKSKTNIIPWPVFINITPKKMILNGKRNIIINYDGSKLNADEKIKIMQSAEYLKDILNYLIGRDNVRIEVNNEGDIPSSEGINIFLNYEKDLKIGGIFQDNIDGDVLNDLMESLPVKIKDITQLDNLKEYSGVELEYLKEIRNSAYKLSITEENVQILAANPRGIFYGVQSLLMMSSGDIIGSLESFREKKDEQMPNENPKSTANNIEIPACDVYDFPRFKWRGFMMDICRHFFGKEIIKRMIDIIGLLKFNILHLHLTEDQGWRIEIKKYPKLTEIGSKRKDTQIRIFKKKGMEGKPHEGFLTQNDIKELIEYAKKRYIQIIPEIEMPGHSQAALAAYPEYSCTGGPFEVATTWGVKRDVYCAGKERTYQFLEGILDEVIGLFESKIIHIGGDEVPKDRWKECPDCQRKIKEEGLKDENELQVYFTNRIADYLKSKDRRLMGWDEILGADLDLSAIAQYWHGKNDKILEHLRKGRQVVMTHSSHVYLDHPEMIKTLKRLYSYKIVPEELESEYQKNILGIEAPIWTEWVPSLQRLEYQIFPRLIGVAELGWTQLKHRNYKNFKERVDKLLRQFDMAGINYNKDWDRMGFIYKVKKLFGK